MNELEFYANPDRAFLHDAILDTCRRFPARLAMVDTSEPSPKYSRITYAQYGDLMETVAKGLIRNGVHPGDVVAIYLNNCWEFAVAYHASTLCGAIPTFINPSYREREVGYQLQNSAARILITDGNLISSFDLPGIASLKMVFCTRHHLPGTLQFSALLEHHVAVLPDSIASS